MAMTGQIPTSALKMQSAVTTGNGGTLMLRSNSETLNLWLQSAGTTSGGTLSIEEAYWPDDTVAYAGTWSVIATVSASTFTGGAGVMVHYPGNFWAVRVRISADITGGGTVTVYGWGS